MNAALLNSSRQQTLNAGPEIPREATWDTTWEQVAGGVVVNYSPKPSQGLDLDRIKNWAESGQKLLDAGKNPGMTVNPSAMLAAVASGAAAGSAIPGIGTVAGAVIAAVVYVVSAFIGGAFGPGPSIYDNAGPNVHYWWTNYAPQALLDWAQANGTFNNLIAAQAASAQGYLVWLLEVHNWVAMPPPWSWQASVGYQLGNPPYSRIDADYVWEAMGRPAVNTEERRSAWLQDFYANFGVDYAATKAAWLNRPLNSQGALMMKDRRFVSDQELQEGTETPGGAEGSQGSKLALGAGIAVAALALINTEN